MLGNFVMLRSQGAVDPFMSMCNGGGDAPAPPDYRPIAAANERAAEIAREDAREQRAFVKPYYDKAAAVAERVGTAQETAMRRQTELADEYHQRMKTLFYPIEEGLAADAQSYDTAGRREQVAAQREADVRGAYDQAAGEAREAQAARGINPASGAAGILESDLGLARGAAIAGARNQGRREVETMGWARRADVANLGRNLPSSQAASAGLAINAGQAATNAAGQPVGMADALYAPNRFATGVGMQANQANANMMSQGYSDQMRAYQANQASNSSFSGGVGTLAGGVVGSFVGAPWLGAAAGGALGSSSKKVKHAKRPVDDQATLEQVKDLPVDRWRYNRGVEDGGEHVGPYAEDVQQRFGDQAAPGGDKLDLVSMNGIALSAVKGLAQKVDALEQTLGKVAVRVAAGGGLNDARRTP